MSYTHTGDLCTDRPLFGGALVSSFPPRFVDVSNMRDVPDHQEVFVDPTRDESLIFELLDLKTIVPDHGSATWFLNDLANEQDAEGTTNRKKRENMTHSLFAVPTMLSNKWCLSSRGYVMLMDYVVPTMLSNKWCLSSRGYVMLQFRNNPAIITTAVGQMSISKGRQGRDAQNIVKVYLANLRLKDVATDVLITAYEPMLINPLSETAASVGPGLAVPAAQSGRLPMAEVFKSAVYGFKVNDWGLFGAAA